MLKNTQLLVALGSLLSACAEPPKQSPLTRDEAIAIARHYAGSHFKKVDGDDLLWGAFETEKAWVVKWIPDRDAMGGTITVVIDKKNKEVFTAFATQ